MPGQSSDWPEMEDEGTDAVSETYQEHHYVEAGDLGEAILNGQDVSGRSACRVISVDHDEPVSSCVFSFTYRGPQYDVPIYAVYWTDGARGGAELFPQEYQAREMFLTELQRRLEDARLDGVSAWYTGSLTYRVHVTPDGVDRLELLPAPADPTYEEADQMPPEPHLHEQAMKLLNEAIHRTWRPLEELATSPIAIRWEA